jgi:uncharacterized protein YqjF (DUF2071 family)
MISFLKNHPFAVEAFFEDSVVLTFAVPKEQLQALIPRCLTLELLNNTWAFIAIAMVQTKGLRPKGFPEFFGCDFFLIGYRIFVNYTTNSGKRLRGLYILKSETDKKRMELLGNVFSHYNYSTTDIKLLNYDKTIEIKSNQSNFKVEIERAQKQNVLLPENSPFVDWKEARKFAGPLPFTFTYNPLTNNVLIIEGVRQYWTPQPIKVIRHAIPYFCSLNLTGIILANAFLISKIPYYWKKGRTEQWKG